MIYEKIKRLCAERDTNIYNLEKACGIANGTIGKWQTRKSSPRIETVLNIANYFVMTVDELLRDEGKENDS